MADRKGGVQTIAKSFAYSKGNIHQLEIQSILIQWPKVKEAI